MGRVPILFTGKTNPRPRGENGMKTNEQRLAGRNAVVTGASKGIGAAIAQRLAAEGAGVVVNYARDREGTDRVVAAITAEGGRAVAVKADLSKVGEAGQLFAEGVRAFGGVDILVNNAGVYEFAPLEGVTPEHFHRQFDLNVLGLLLTTQEAVKHFPSRGGSIINISSSASTLTPPNTSVYSATKAAVDAITRTLAKELGGRGIRVNAINPGMVITEGLKQAGFDAGEFRRQLESQTPLGRIGGVDDIAPAAAFLASSEASWITGETIVIAGGLR